MKSVSSVIIIIFLCICFFLLGILTEKTVLSKYMAELKNKESDFRSLTEERKFTNPLLDCEPDFVYINPKLEDIMNERVAFHNRSSSIAEISVYFRNLNGGGWYGVNERENFIPGSLNKVPLMMAAFRLSEEYPEVLTRKFLFDEISATFSNADSTGAVDKSEKYYGYYDVIEYMIKHSHNETAAFLLEIINEINPRFIEKVFTDLGIKAPDGQTVYEMNTKDYASFFRLLYNSTYINFKNSEMALFFLSETDFKDGLVKGIGENIIISHKYGQISDKKLMQLHDCGIVYYPGNHFILCVMVKGYDIAKMASVIQDISKVVYDEVKNQVVLQ